MKELREFIRYPLETGLYKKAFVEINGLTALRFMISDLSTGGFSFVIDMENIAESEFSLDKFLFIRIIFEQFTIDAEVQKRWSLMKKTDNGIIYTAGVSFKVISNEDRLRLNEIIEYIRSESSASSSKINKS